MKKSSGSLTKLAPISGVTPQHTDITSFSFSSKQQQDWGRSQESNIAITAQSSWVVPGPEGLTSQLGHGTYRLNSCSMQFFFSAGQSGDQTCYTVSIDGRQFSSTVKNREEWSGKGGQLEGSHDIVAPVPGKVIKVGVISGTHVKAGTSVFVLESMKMEFEVKTQKSGIISEIKVKEGDQVTTGDLLAIWMDEISEL